jgi:fumarylacetoacetate (FAA) hydrolase
MKLVTFKQDNTEKIGLFHQNKIFNLTADGRFPADMISLISNATAMDTAKAINESFVAGGADAAQIIDANSVTLLAPIPRPPSCRDGYAFRQHVASARRNRGVDMIPEFDEFPIFYFTNHNAICGEGELRVEADVLNKFDHELEVAIVIGKKGRNIKAEDAESYIAGYCIMNDFSARTLQMEEMKLNLGPAKGKDFATAIGPWLVTPDELEKLRLPAKAGHTGVNYNLEMTAVHNGKEVSRGNMSSMDWTFSEIIERVSYGVDIFPGDVIGSGTVGTGCYLELNGTWAREAKERGETHTPVWIEDGDNITLEITGLGVLSNDIKKASNYSILSKKKNV